MLSTHYVSVFMCMFYIDWQQYWKCDWILNIGGNAHGKRTASIKQPQHKWQTWPVDSQASSDIGETCVLSMLSCFLVTRLSHSSTASQCDHFLDAICICCLKLYQIFFFFFFGGGGWGGGGGGGGVGGLSSNVFAIWWRILISVPPRVFRRFKRRSCFILL